MLSYKQEVLMEYLLKKEDLIPARAENGSLIFTHPFLLGEIIWNPKSDPVPALFQRIKEFGERNRTLLSPELAKACNFFDEMYEDLRRQMEGEDDFDLEEEYLG